MLCKKTQHMLFDAREEVITIMPTQINLPNCPLEFWMDSELKEIGEVLGTFIAVDVSYKNQ